MRKGLPWVISFTFINMAGLLIISFQYGCLCDVKISGVPRESGEGFKKEPTFWYKGIKDPMYKFCENFGGRSDNIARVFIPQVCLLLGVLGFR